MADSRPERVDFSPERADFRPERAWRELTDGRMNEQTNEQTDEQTKVPCVLQDVVPFGAAAQKGSKTEEEKRGGSWKIKESEETW